MNLLTINKWKQLVILIDLWNQGEYIAPDFFQLPHILRSLHRFMVESATCKCVSEYQKK